MQSCCCLPVPDRHRTLTVRKFRRRTAETSRTTADLHQLCVLYQSVGAIGLPRDVIEEIVQFHHGDLETLMACSLTCRALFSTVRGLIHERVRVWLWRNYPSRELVNRITAKVLPRRRPRDWPEGNLKYLSTAGLLGYAREVSIDFGQSFIPEALEAFLPYFHSFTRVHTLSISGLDVSRFSPGFEQYFVQFVPTLRSLHLPQVMGGAREVLEFVCEFPRLDDLSLTQPSFNFADVPPRLSVEDSPPLKGALVLGGRLSTPARFLLGIPGGLHFRCVDVGGVGKTELGEILAACSSDLETLSLRPRSRKFSFPHSSLS